MSWPFTMARPTSRNCGNTCKQTSMNMYIYIYIYVCVCERHCIKCYVYISYGSYKFTKPWNLVQKGPCIFIPKQKGPCMIISKQKGACILISKQKGPCIFMSKQKGPCIFISKQKGPCMIISKQKGAWGHKFQWNRNGCFSVEGTNQVSASPLRNVGRPPMANEQVRIIRNIFFFLCFFNFWTGSLGFWIHTFNKLQNRARTVSWSIKGFAKMCAFLMKKSMIPMRIHIFKLFFWFFWFDNSELHIFKWFFWFFWFWEPQRKFVIQRNQFRFFFNWGCQNQKNQKNHLNMCISIFPNQKNQKNHLNMCIRIGIIDFLLENTSL